MGNSGWSIERLLRVMVNSMNGLSNARQVSGPTPFEAPDYQEFKRAAKLFRALQLSGLATEGYGKREREEIPVIRFEPGFWETDEAKELAGLIGLRPGQPFATLDTFSRRRRPAAVGLEMRSLAGILFFLSHAVEVPNKDLEAGRVAITRHADGRAFDWLARQCARRSLVPKVSLYEGDVLYLGQSQTSALGLVADAKLPYLNVGSGSLCKVRDYAKFCVAALADRP